jgi:hypothetical protein
MKWKLLFLFLVFTVFGIGYLYFFQISPVFLEKPQLEKPLNEEQVTFDHVAYLLNEMDAYRLQKIPFTGEMPVIEVSLPDTGQRFVVEVENLQMAESTGEPDIIITVDRATLLKIVQEGSIEAFVEALEKGKIGIEPLKEEKTLALKGYKSIYDKVTIHLSGVTGNVVLYPAGTVRMINLLLFISISIIAWIILEKR